MDWILRVYVREGKTVHVSSSCATASLPRYRAEDVREVGLFIDEVQAFCSSYAVCRKCGSLIRAG